jgi:hypothetical protein
LVCLQGSAEGGGERGVLVFEDGAEVEQDAAGFDADDDGRSWRRKRAASSAALMALGAIASR